MSAIRFVTVVCLDSTHASSTLLAQITVARTRESERAHIHTEQRFFDSESLSQPHFRHRGSQATVQRSNSMPNPIESATPATMTQPSMQTLVVRFAAMETPIVALTNENAQLQGTAQHTKSELCWTFV